MTGFEHGAGDLRINPIYRMTENGDDVHLPFFYPTVFLALPGKRPTSPKGAGP